MKLPFVTRGKYDRLIVEHDELLKKYSKDRGIVAYMPQDNQKPAPGTNLAHHDKRIGWVKPVKFDTYDDYLAALRKEKK